MLGGTTLKKKPTKVHDRRSSDLPINAVVVPVLVDDPYPINPEEKIAVVRSLRDDPLAGMRARGYIDETQFNAGLYWQWLLEEAQPGGGIRSVDPGKEAVDGKQLPEPITDRQIKAAKRLRKADEALGHEGSGIVRDILGSPMTIERAAQRRGMASEHERLYLGRRLRECLDTLAVLFGYATRDLRTGRVER